MEKVNYLNRQILITGVTGFIGSSLAASFLERGLRVIALVRDDPNGHRAKAAVACAASGFGYRQTSHQFNGLQVLSIDFGDLENTLDAAVLSDVTDVWHCAAEMSYSSAQLASSYQSNVLNSAQLMRLVSQASRQTPRFYYMSTAYVAGVGQQEVPEELHVAPQLHNCYQITKWGAENALYLQHQKTKWPLTIFRPSIVIGHRQTGWTATNKLGIYMLLDGLMECMKLNLKDYELSLNVDPLCASDLISIDQLVADAVDLTMRAQVPHAFEVFHCTGGVGLSNVQIIDRLVKAAGMKLRVGEPLTLVDKRFERAIKANLPFMSKTWHFNRQGIVNALGKVQFPSRLTIQEVDHLAKWYLNACGAQGVIEAQSF
jgi:nucleoside-diphosphate-sugar epimerase